MTFMQSSSLASILPSNVLLFILYKIETKQFCSIYVMFYLFLFMTAVSLVESMAIQIAVMMPPRNMRSSFHHVVQLIMIIFSVDIGFVEPNPVKNTIRSRRISYSEDFIVVHKEPVTVMKRDPGRMFHQAGQSYRQSLMRGENRVELLNTILYSILLFQYN